MSFSGEISLFSGHLRFERGLSPRTVASYESDLRDFSRWLAGRGIEDAGALSREDAVSYLDGLRSAGAKASTCARRFSAIRAFTRFLAAEKRMAADPLAQTESPRREKTLPKTLSEETVKGLVESVDPSDLPGAGTGAADRIKTAETVRDRAILETLYGCGMRVSELCALHLQDIDFEGGVVRCFGKGSKERVVPLGSGAAEWISRYVDSWRAEHGKGNPDEDAVFLSRLGAPLTRVSVFQMVRRRAEAYAAKGGAIDPARVSPHVFRHCFATHLLAHGAGVRPIQEMLGHASVATTQIYTHVDASRMAAVHRRFHPRA